MGKVHIRAIFLLATIALTAGSDCNKPNGLESVNARLEALERHLLAVNSTLYEKEAIIKKMTVSDVSFEVTCQSQSRLTLNGNQIYKFQRVTLNNGGGYHAPTGIFECPVTGTYLFWASILPYSGKYVHVVLMKEKHALFSTTSKGAPASFSYIVRVRRGEKVWFRTFPYTTVIWCTIHSGYGGTLIHQH